MLTGSDTIPAPSQDNGKGEIRIDSATKAAGLELIGMDDCTVCHRVEGKSIGPSYLAIAEKYKPLQPVVDKLVQTILKGSQGVWGQVPMTPHPNLSVVDGQKMILYILSLRKSGDKASR